MKLQRRQVLQLAAGAASACAFPNRASALDYPARPVHWVVTTAAGGSGDITARLIGRQLSEQLGQPFIIDNRPGAGGDIGTEIVARGPPDGYMLLNLTTDFAVNTTLYGNVGFSHEIQPVAGIARAPLIMLVNSSVAAATVPDFIAYAKENPTKINFASVGNGTPPHLAGELFKILTGVAMVHVPYRGGALAMTDLLSGQVQVMFSNLPTMDYVKAGKLRALAVSTAKRSDVLPDLPAIAEFVPGYEASAWFGFGVRKNTPAEIVEKLSRETGLALTNPGVKAGLANLNGSPMALSPAEFEKLVADDAAKWGNVIRTANIKPG